MVSNTRSSDVAPPAVAHDLTRTVRVSWGAILAGFFCALAIQTLFAMAGLAWGLGTIDPAEEARPFAGLVVGSGIYWGATSIFSLFVGGWIAARLAAVPFTISSVLNGVTVWALATLITGFMIMSAISTAARTAVSTARTVASGAVAAGEGGTQLVTGALGAVDGRIAQQVREAARQRDLTAQDIRQELRVMYNQVVSEREQQRAGAIAEETVVDIIRTPGDFSSDISTGLDRMFAGPQAVLGKEDRQELVKALAERFDITEREAGRIVNRWQTRWKEASQRLDKVYEEARQETLEAVGAVTDTASNAAITLAVTSLLGLLAAALGGAVGRVRSGLRHD